MSFSDWQLIRDGDADHTVIGIDFASGRAEAGFVDLFANVDTVSLVVGPNFPSPAGDATTATDPVAVVRAWLDDLGERSLRVDAVAGYCAGAGLAYSLADALARSGAAEPHVILFDPVVPGPELLYSYYLAALDSYRGAFSEAERLVHKTAAETSLRAARALVASELTHVMTELSAAYAEIASRAADRMGLDARVGQFMIDRFSALLAYLVTNARAGLAPCPESHPPTILLSRDHEPPPVLVAKVHRFPVERPHLLSDLCVAATMSASSPYAIAPRES